MRLRIMTAKPVDALPVDGRMTPRVAVLISTYDGAKFLEAQLTSLAAQTDVRLEVFARDDGSHDDTLAIMRKHASIWPRLAEPIAGENLGPAKSFLRLLVETPGDFDYYAFCDQDDIWRPDKLSRAVARLERDAPESPGLYCSAVRSVTEDLSPIGETFRDSDARFNHLLFENIACGVTLVMNRAARALIADNPPVEGVIMHDWWCALVVSALGVVVHDPEPGADYRQHHGNVVGARGGFTKLLRMLRHEPRRIYPIYVQAQEFSRLFRSSLSDENRRILDRLLHSRRSLWRRLAFAASRHVVHTRLKHALFMRALMAAGFY